MNHNIPRSNYALSDKMTKGYIASAISFFGLSVTQSFFHGGARRYITHSEVNVFLTNMKNMFSSSEYKEGDIDYKKLVFIYIGMKDFFQLTGNNKCKKIMKQIGKRWCLQNKSPVSGFDCQSIMDIILTESSFRFPLAQTCTSAEIVSLLEVLCQAFFQVSKLTGQVLSLSDVVICEITDCPLCGNDQPPCLIWWGVIEGFLDWLNTQPALSSTQLRLQIDSTNSHGHHLVVSLR